MEGGGVNPLFLCDMGKNIELLFETSSICRIHNKMKKKHNL
jgi:hypothetical protein